jgi:hypothetical protein
MRTFSSAVNATPAVCSPSRSVVSLITAWRTVVVIWRTSATERVFSHWLLQTAFHEKTPSITKD